MSSWHRPYRVNLVQVGHPISSELSHVPEKPDVATGVPVPFAAVAARDFGSRVCRACCQGSARSQGHEAVTEADGEVAG